MPRKPRIHVISDRDFSQIWLYAQKVNTAGELLDRFYNFSSEKFIDFSKKYSLSDQESFRLINAIFTLSKLSFFDILSQNNLKKSVISSVFCIPIRTIEEWYNGNNPCPAYIRLSILRYYDLIDLGKYIYVQADYERGKYKHSIYQKHIQELEQSIPEYSNTSTISFEEYEKIRSDILARTDYLKQFMK